MTPPGEKPTDVELKAMKDTDTDIQKKPENNVLTFWSLVLDLSNTAQLLQLQLAYAKWTTPQEFWMFIGIMKSTWLNPFKKELWCVKYGTSPAQIFIGRDWYRKIAKQHPDYKWHRVDVVCTKDICQIKNGQIVNHEYNLTDRWEIIWAYCIVNRWKLEDLMHFVDFDEYNTGKSKWKESPKTMIKKVAEAQTLRMWFDDLLEWTYDESETFSPETIIEAETKVIVKKWNKLQEKYANLEKESASKMPLPKAKVKPKPEVKAEIEIMKSDEPQGMDVDMQEDTDYLESNQSEDDN